MAPKKPQPDDMSPEEEQALSQELHARELEDAFFGKENAMASREELDDKGHLNIERVAQDVKRQVEESKNPSTPEKLIDLLQAEGRIDESMHTPTLTSALRLLGERIGLRIKIGEFTLFPDNKRGITLQESGLNRFLKRGAFAGSLVTALLLAAPASAQQLKPGMDLINDPDFQIVTGSGTEDVWHNEWIIGLLLLLGLGKYGVRKFLKWKKKNKAEEGRRSVIP